MEQLKKELLQFGCKGKVAAILICGKKFAGRKKKVKQRIDELEQQGLLNRLYADYSMGQYQWYKQIKLGVFAHYVVDFGAVKEGFEIYPLEDVTNVFRCNMVNGEPMAESYIALETLNGQRKLLTPCTGELRELPEAIDQIKRSIMGDARWQRGAPCRQCRVRLCLYFRCKPYKMDIILAVRTFISFMVSFAKYLLLYIIICFLFGIYINISVELVIICVISLIGFLGLGIALSGITMIFSKTASVETIISYLLLLLSGAVISYDNINHSVFNVMKLCPFVYEIYLAQNIVAGESLGSGQTIYLLAINVIMLLLGVFVFRAIHKYVTRVGISNDY